MLRKVFVEVEQSDPDLYEVEKSVALPELKCGDTGHAYVVLKLVDGNAAEPAAFSCELKFQVRTNGDDLASLSCPPTREAAIDPPPPPLPLHGFFRVLVGLGVSSSSVAKQRWIVHPTESDGLPFVLMLPSRPTH